MSAILEYAISMKVCLAVRSDPPDCNFLSRLACSSILCCGLTGSADPKPLKRYAEA